jgi:hypothetical protein
MRILVVALVLVSGWGAYDGYVHRDRHHPPGQIAPDEPRQRNIANGTPFRRGDFVLTPRAEFSAEARVLGKENYYVDAGAKLIPVDFAMGWGSMSDTALIDRLRISQSGRFYFWGYSGEAPAPHQEIIRSSANMHLIPADAAVKKVLSSARVGDVVAIEGDLVDAKSDGGWSMTTSLTRDDSGAGACEIVYVRRASIRR